MPDPVWSGQVPSFLQSIGGWFLRWQPFLLRVFGKRLQYIEGKEPELTTVFSFQIGDKVILYPSKQRR
jgi:hypothetical protein